jgi:hypothetical protein
MPKVDIDYSNTIIYKITCKDPNITDVYVGHTTNFVQRKCAHKQNCIKDHCKLYTTIRNNGGWDNWSMEIINFFNCKDHYEARQKEQEYFELLHATLNSIQPMPKPKFKPIEAIEPPIQAVEIPIICCENTQPNAKKYSCEKCDFNTLNKTDYKKHLSTQKHKNIENEILLKQLETEKHYICKCGKEYAYDSGYYRHKKTCTYEDIIQPVQNSTYDKDLILMLIKQNAELLEIIKNMTNKQVVNEMSESLNNTTV